MSPEVGYPEQTAAAGFESLPPEIDFGVLAGQHELAPVESIFEHYADTEVTIMGVTMPLSKAKEICPHAGDADIMTPEAIEKFTVKVLQANKIEIAEKFHHLLPERKADQAPASRQGAEKSTTETARRDSGKAGNKSGDSRAEAGSAKATGPDKATSTTLAEDIPPAMSVEAAKSAAGDQHAQLATDRQEPAATEAAETISPAKAPLVADAAPAADTPAAYVAEVFREVLAEQTAEAARRAQADTQASIQTGARPAPPPATRRAAAAEQLTEADTGQTSDPLARASRLAAVALAPIRRLFSPDHHSASESSVDSEPTDTPDAAEIEGLPDLTDTAAGTDGLAAFAEQPIAFEGLEPDGIMMADDAEAAGGNLEQEQAYSFQDLLAAMAELSEYPVDEEPLFGSETGPGIGIAPPDGLDGEAMSADFAAASEPADGAASSPPQNPAETAIDREPDTPDTPPLQRQIAERLALVTEAEMPAILPLANEIVQASRFLGSAGEAALDDETRAAIESRLRNLCLRLCDELGIAADEAAVQLLLRQLRQTEALRRVRPLPSAALRDDPLLDEGTHERKLDVFAGAGSDDSLDHVTSALGSLILAAVHRQTLTSAA